MCEHAAALERAALTFGQLAAKPLYFAVRETR
jgi:hypothetical protein